MCIYIHIHMCFIVDACLFMDYSWSVCGCLEINQVQWIASEEIGKKIRKKLELSHDVKPLKEGCCTQCRPPCCIPLYHHKLVG